MLVIMGTISLIPFTFFMSLVRLAFLVFLFLPGGAGLPKYPNQLIIPPVMRSMAQLLRRLQSGHRARTRSAR